MDYFRELAPRLIDQGWHAVVPLLGKRPVVKGWNRYNSESLDREILRDWCDSYSNFNVGLPVNGFVAVDVDVEQSVTARAIERFADEVLGPTPAVRIGKAPRFLRLYRSPERIRTIRRHPVEIFGASGLFAAFGTHPITRREYFWPLESPLSLSPSDLPQISALQLRTFLNKCASSGAPTRRPAASSFRSAHSQRRRRKRGQVWLDGLRRELREAQPGSLHNTMISVAASLVCRGYSDGAIRLFINDHFAAPQSGPYSEVWLQIDDAIRTARRKWKKEPDVVSFEVFGR